MSRSVRSKYAGRWLAIVLLLAMVACQRNQGAATPPPTQPAAATALATQVPPTAILTPVPTGTVLGPALPPPGSTPVPTSVPYDIEGEEVDLRVDDPVTFIINDCPEGNRNVIIADVDGLGPNGAMFRGVQGFLKAGDELIRSVDCGNGEEFYAFGRILSIGESEVIKFLRYHEPQRRGQLEGVSG